MFLLIIYGCVPCICVPVHTQKLPIQMCLKYVNIFKCWVVGWVFFFKMAGQLTVWCWVRSASKAMSILEHNPELWMDSFRVRKWSLIPLVMASRTGETQPGLGSNPIEQGLGVEESSQQEFKYFWLDLVGLHESYRIAQTRLLLEFFKDIKAWRIAGDHGQKKRGYARTRSHIQWR